MNSNFSECLEMVLLHEGGNDDDKRDPGGRTSRGILQREWTIYIGAHPGQDLPSDVWHAPQFAVEDIYRTKYWDKLRCDELPSGIDYAIFDYGVNSGIWRGAEVLQRILGVTVDGQIGSVTIAAAQGAIATTTINAICDERLTFLRKLSTWSTFGRGWSTRIADVRATAIAMASGKAIHEAPKPVAKASRTVVPAPHIAVGGIGAAIAAALASYGANWGIILAVAVMAIIGVIVVRRQTT